jgi:translation initiation factor 2 beta subunit (eIF-2beta)/eIF-5
MPLVPNQRMDVEVKMSELIPTTFLVVCEQCNTAPHMTLVPNLEKHKCEVCGKIRPVVTFKEVPKD